ncbi:hypothetical protein [Bordetella bronchiseptica]|uniref:hypothetical protein n=1 Tax=Bordetella bronchiseptica TaxID=518 RepID=UPI000305C297|nr:hypothetical protein [Bordetella bronchiseptica]KCV26206.1 hypothetical protein L489_3915 [Bordetella bronchiseptica 00-P-2730]SHT43645.1 Uncharacterised protein [Mycobacteroides abscessus subsp. abscessus]KDD21210.1 hypothetical protein L525_3525 [Bordetella bronchiseptica MBORD782]KDD30898.1 hypothetical protein L528_2217 [Bordetella bronchiseptica MBORD849]KDD39403.1 hypothetical protein L527_2085 [Bordetella bronchiseptica MBORD839]
MTYDEALEIARRAMDEAIRLHGIDRAKIYEELRAREGRDPDLAEALRLIGLVVVTATRH